MAMKGYSNFQSSKTGASSSGSLVSCPGHSLMEESYVILSSADSYRNIYIYIYTGYIPTQWTTDAGRHLYKYIPLTLFVRVRKGCEGFYCERELETEHNWNILTPKLMAVNVVSFSFIWCSTRALESTLLGAGFLYCILSASSLDPNSSGLPGPFGLMWLSLPHLVYNSVRSSTQLARRTQLSYIIVRRPLDLWNRMFNRHQAEITVMLFRSHSLSVRQSMRVWWDFLTCPILLANFRPRDFFSELPLECVTSFRCITLNGILLGPNVKI